MKYNEFLQAWKDLVNLFLNILHQRGFPERLIIVASIFFTKFFSLLYRIRFKFSQLLLLFLISSGLLYFSETTYKDLWANLFATMVALLFIERIVNASGKQRSERAITHIRHWLSCICEDFISHINPPDDWEKKLDNTSDFLRFYERTVTNQTISTIHDLEFFISAYAQLMDEKLIAVTLEFIDYLKIKVRSIERNNGWVEKTENIEDNKTLLKIAKWVVEATMVTIKTIDKGDLHLDAIPLYGEALEGRSDKERFLVTHIWPSYDSYLKKARKFQDYLKNIIDKK